MIPSVGHQLVALALCSAEIVVRAVRIRLLVPGSGVSMWQAITVNAYGDLASAVTPARFGGDPARFLGFRRAGIATPQAVAGLAVETLIDWALLAIATLALTVAFAGTAASGAQRLLALATSPGARLLVALVLALVIISAVVAVRYRRRSATGPAATVVQAWRSTRDIGRRTMFLAAGLTALSMVMRIAILPVLVAGTPGLNPPALWLGSFALLFGQLILPTPAGAGGVELGFAGGFAGTLGTRDLVALVLVWRIYTLVVGAGLGLVLFARAFLAAWSTRRRYNPKSSVNVRSQL